MRDGQVGIETAGARAVVVVCQNEAAVRAHFARDPMPFPIAIDRERIVARAFGVYALLGLDSINIARPATFIIDAGGVIRLRFAARTQFQRLPIEAILTGLRDPARPVPTRP